MEEHYEITVPQMQVSAVGQERHSVEEAAVLLQEVWAQHNPAKRWHRKVMSSSCAARKMIAVLLQKPPKRWWRLTLGLVVLAAVVVILLNSPVVNAMAALGGLVSELMVEMAGTADSSLLVEVSDEMTVIGFAPGVTTGTATNATPTSITFNGTVTNMQGLPTSEAYFQWGYTSALGSTTPATTMTATGAYSATVSYNPANEIFFRAVVDGDGTTYGETVSAGVPPSGAGGFILRNILATILAFGVSIAGMLTIGRGNWVMILVSILVGLMTYFITAQLLEIL